VIEAGLLSDAGNNPLQRREIPIGDVIQAAINSGLRVEAEIFANGAYLDTEDLVRAVRNEAVQEI